MTLYTALLTICKAAAPMIPFMTEEIYQNLVRTNDKTAPESIHLCDFPEVKTEWIDKRLETDMDEVVKVVVLGRACRNAASIKNRQPIRAMFVKTDKEELSEFYTEIIEDELNVKNVQYTDDVRSFTSYSFKPQLRTLGKRFGSQINALKELLAGLNGNEAMDELNEKATLTVVLNGNEEVIAKEDLLIETAQTEGYVSDSDNGITVVLDTNLTPELIEEGYVRELISKLQTMRKEAGFEVTDHIRVYQTENEKIAEILKKHEEEIRRIVLAEEIVIGQLSGVLKEWDINGEKTMLGVERTI